MVPRQERARWSQGLSVPLPMVLRDLGFIASFKKKQDSGLHKKNSVAIVLRDLGFIASFTGAIFGSCMIYIFPSLMHLAATRKVHRQTPSHTNASLSTLLCSSLCMYVCTCLYVFVRVCTCVCVCARAPLAYRYIAKAAPLLLYCPFQHLIYSYILNRHWLTRSEAGGRGRPKAGQELNKTI